MTNVNDIHILEVEQERASNLPWQLKNAMVRKYKNSCDENNMQNISMDIYFEL